MAWMLRLNVPDGWYHVTSCGFERRDIFRDDRDRVHYLELRKSGQVQPVNDDEFWRRVEINRKR